MITKETMCIVKNRSASEVVYTILEDGIQRTFRPGETKQIPYGELVKLTYQPGGRTLMDRYFLISKKEVTDSLGLPREEEYEWDIKRVAQLLQYDSLERFLDCLDFAPEGVIDMVKQLAVELPLGDPRKKKALREKTGLDVDAIYRNTVLGEEDEQDKATTKTRRVQPAQTTGRRVSG